MINFKKFTLGFNLLNIILLLTLIAIETTFLLNYLKQEMCMFSFRIYIKKFVLLIITFIIVIVNKL